MLRQNQTIHEVFFSGFSEAALRPKRIIKENFTHCHSHVAPSHAPSTAHWHCARAAGTRRGTPGRAFDPWARTTLGPSMALDLGAVLCDGMWERGGVRDCLTD